MGRITGRCNGRTAFGEPPPLSARFVLPTNQAWHNCSFMADLERIEGEIRSLSKEELAEFRAWFQEYDWQAWDRQLEKDVADGKLDFPADTALGDHEAGRTKAL